MSKRTTHDMLCEAIERRAWSPMPRRGGYTVYAKFKQGKILRVLFVGRNGALRMANRMSVSSSVSLSDEYKSHILSNW